MLGGKKNIFLKYTISECYYIRSMCVCVGELGGGEGGTSHGFLTNKLFHPLHEVLLSMHLLQNI